MTAGECLIIAPAELESASQEIKSGNKSLSAVPEKAVTFDNRVRYLNTAMKGANFWFRNCPGNAAGL